MPFDGTKPETRSPVARALERAAEIIEARGIMQGALEGPNGEVCCYQAMNLAIKEIGGDHWKVHKAFEESNRRPDGILFGICRWNNVPGRTKEDAAAQFRKAARAA